MTISETHREPKLTAAAKGEECTKASKRMNER